MTAPAIAVRVCGACGLPLTVQQRAACSRRCAARLAATARHARHSQRGANNPNWKGGRAQHPVVYTRAFKAQHPDILRAHRIVASALRSGILTRPEDCQSCIRRLRVDAHHWDYSQPLRVEWLCRKCHIAADRLRQRGFVPTPAFLQQPNRYAEIIRQTRQVTRHGGHTVARLSEVPKANYEVDNAVAGRTR